MTAKNSYTGLSNEEVIRSREQYGANVLTQLEKSPWWVKFLQKFADPLIIILLVAGLLSIGISFYEYFGLHESSDVFFEPDSFITFLLISPLASNSFNCDINTFGVISSIFFCNIENLLSPFIMCATILSFHFPPIRSSIRLNGQL